ncbi:MAG: hypothetical protein HZB53_16375 [Chloroflexi bacterium]|nr:hypothetical protein [Chloroflexota bacterium]
MNVNTFGYALGLLILLLASGCGTTAAASRDSQFLAIFQVPTHPRLYLKVEVPDTQPNVGVLYIVDNYTGNSVYFEDDTLGLRAYKYYDDQREWRRVNVSLRVFEKNIVVPSGDPARFPHGLFIRSAFEEKGALRLAVVGWTNPAARQPIAAYADIDLK